MTKAVTVLTAAKITELTLKYPRLGEDTFVHERDYNQAENGRIERDAEIARLRGMVDSQAQMKEALRDVYAEAAASWGTSGANAALRRIRERTQRYGNPTACSSCPDPGGCALPDGTFECRFECAPSS